MPSRKPIKGYAYIRKANRGVDTGPSDEDPIDAPEEGPTDVGHDPTGGAGLDAMAADGSPGPGSADHAEAIARGADPSGGGRTRIRTRVSGLEGRSDIQTTPCVQPTVGATPHQRHRRLRNGRAHLMQRVGVRTVVRSHV